MSKSISRSAIDAMLPPGALWNPQPEKGFDQQLDGICDTIEETREVVETLADIRNPDKTPIFEDLERNYGIKPNETVSDDIRVERLAQKVYQGSKVNSVDDLQSDLSCSGFNLQVHKNDPPVDPALFLTQAFQITAGSDYAYAGFNLGADVLAFAASLGGELLVNTPIELQSDVTDMVAGGDIAYSGYHDASNVLSVAGYFIELEKIFREYPVPTNPIYWPLVFFVGGDATRDPVTDELTEIESGLVDSNRKDELTSIILADKSLCAWCGLVINFT